MKREKLEELTHDELIDLIIAYDEYVIGFDEDFIGLDRTPVCLMEFYDCEYQEMSNLDDE